ncbi:hypothetical protein I309_04510 [Cryptococcus deuterogattii LA55]|nr:hypothetical protein I309_04510 [Cryptococcus deuterogattii LA55]KIR91923.1 hypothetical protein I304_04087 [Cryptococcus deuterogattii CBS 10090]
MDIYQASDGGLYRLDAYLDSYDEETFWTDAETWAVQLQEGVQLPPPLDPHDHLSHLKSLSDTQSKALQIAYANLSQHLQPLVDEFQSFASRVEASFKTEEELIKSAKLDMALLPKLVINPALLKKKDDEGKVRTMGDYVNAKKMEQVRESCRILHAEMAAFNDRSAEIENEFAEGLARLEVALGQLPQLSGSGAADVHQDFTELDQAMRDDLVALTAVKNQFTFDIHLHLRQVAHFQSQIHELIEPLRKFDADLLASKDRSAFPHLYRLHQIPFAYAAAVSEVVRRRDFGQMLTEWTRRLRGTLNAFTQVETKRREQVIKESLSQLPFSVPILSESQGPKVEVTLVTGVEALGNKTFGYEEIEKQMRNDPEVIANMEDGDAERLHAMQTSIEGLIMRFDTTADELDRMVEQGELEESHRNHLQSLTEQHEKREQALQMRQGELQEELARLRTDLSEEMSARQALTTELEEKIREQEDWRRDHEDQMEMVAGLQAELTQEKDRATDLGMRLQEALLDVDGLKSAEQTLITQLQELQEERKKALESENEAHAMVKNLESQLAGIKAELEAVTGQLTKAQEDRETALRSQSAEAEKLMRDRIAEADGDRAVLEHQHLTLTRELDNLKLETEKKLAAAQNTAIRQVDGLKAELSLTKAQMRELQRKELTLTDELAVARDTMRVLSQEKGHGAEHAREAVSLVTKYYEVCQRLLHAISTSTTISGSAAQPRSLIPQPLNQSPSKHPISQNPAASTSLSASGKDEIHESVSLVAAQDFDLVEFTEAVTKTIGLVKKWSKSCRQYRDQARNKISFTNFAKGDLEIVVSAPHNFLKVDDILEEQLKTREWIIARIVKTDQAVASGGESLESNPFGLADGLRYCVHTVEEYSVGTSRPYRRNVLSSFTGSQIIPSSHRPISSGGGHAIRSVGMTSIGAGPGQAEPQNEYSPTKEAGEDVSMSGITEQKMGSEGDGQNKSQYPSSTGSFQPSSESSPVRTVPPLPWPSLLPSNIDHEATTQSRIQPVFKREFIHSWPPNISTVPRRISIELESRKLYRKAAICGFEQLILSQGYRTWSRARWKGDTCTSNDCNDFP